MQTPTNSKKGACKTAEGLFTTLGKEFKLQNNENTIVIAVLQAEKKELRTYSGMDGKAVN